MEAYHKIVSPKIQNLVNYLDTELKAEITKGTTELTLSDLDELKLRYNTLREQPIILVMLVKEFLTVFDTKTSKLDREKLKELIERGKKEALVHMMKEDNFDAAAVKRRMELKLPAHVEERVYQYMDLLCDYGTQMGVDKM